MELGGLPHAHACSIADLSVLILPLGLDQPTCRAGVVECRARGARDYHAHAPSLRAAPALEGDALSAALPGLHHQLRAAVCRGPRLPDRLRCASGQMWDSFHRR